jgi:hypothetical protein
MSCTQQTTKNITLVWCNKTQVYWNYTLGSSFKILVLIDGMVLTGNIYLHGSLCTNLYLLVTLMAMTKFINT